MYICIITINSMFSASFVAFFVEKYTLDPRTTPKEYGYVMTGCCVLPMILCMPFFVYAGFIYKKMMDAKAAAGEIDIVEERKKAS
jgi:formate hydrogenlyase subunit 3/multisubunit Na+/H+ antiporter MnhD subunit